MFNAQSMRRQRLENELMLVLLKTGCPSGDVLSAQMHGIDHLQALAERHGLQHHLPQPPPSSPPVSPSGSESTQTSEASPTTTQRTVRFMTPPPPPPPPSNLPQGMAALTRARAWRYQHIAVPGGASGGVAGAHGLDAQYAEGGLGGVSALSPHHADYDLQSSGRSVGGAAVPHPTPLGFTLLDEPEVGENGLYEGERNEAGERHGRGSYRFGDGGVYEGEWRHNLQEGHGAMRYASGSAYEGEWWQGMQEGRGVFRFVSGSEYDGEWVRGKRHGKATYRYADGRAEVARYREGANDRGEGAMWSADRRVAWRIVRDGEYVEEISLDAAKGIADSIGELVPARTR